MKKEIKISKKEFKDIDLRKIVAIEKVEVDDKEGVKITFIIKE